MPAPAVAVAEFVDENEVAESAVLLVVLEDQRPVGAEIAHAGPMAFSSYFLTRPSIID